MFSPLKLPSVYFRPFNIKTAHFFLSVPRILCLFFYEGPSVLYPITKDALPHEPDIIRPDFSRKVVAYRRPMAQDRRTRGRPHQYKTCGECVSCLRNVSRNVGDHPKCSPECILRGQNGLQLDSYEPQVLSKAFIELFLKKRPDQHTDLQTTTLHR